MRLPDDEPRTEVGDNWTVVVVRANPAEVPQLLIDLWNTVAEIDVAFLPHFLIRGWVDAHGISFRILRNPGDAELIVGTLTALLQRRAVDFEFDVPGPLNGWISHGAECAKWNRDRCEILNELSRCVVHMAEKSLYVTDDRFEMTHLSTWLWGLREIPTFQDRTDNQFKLRGGYLDVLTQAQGGYKPGYVVSSQSSIQINLLQE